MAENDESYENLFHFDPNYHRRSFIRLLYRQQTCSRCCRATDVTTGSDKFNFNQWHFDGLFRFQEKR